MAANKRVWSLEGMKHRSLEEESARVLHFLAPAAGAQLPVPGSWYALRIRAKSSPYRANKTQVTTFLLARPSTKRNRKTICLSSSSSLTLFFQLPFLKYHSPPLYTQFLLFLFPHLCLYPLLAGLSLIPFTHLLLHSHPWWSLS